MRERKVREAGVMAKALDFALGGHPQSSIPPAHKSYATVAATGTRPVSSRAEPVANKKGQEGDTLGRKAPPKEKRESRRGNRGGGKSEEPPTPAPEMTKKGKEWKGREDNMVGSPLKVYHPNETPLHGVPH